MLCRACQRASSLARHATAAAPHSAHTAASQSARSLSILSSKQRLDGPHRRHLLVPQRHFPAALPSSLQRRPYSAPSTSTSPTSSQQPPSTPSSSPEKPDYLDAAESQIWDLLVAEFAPAELSVRDISGGCGSMYGIEISSEKFRGASMLKQQRMVNAVLGDMVKQWHGLQLKTRVP